MFVDFNILNQLGSPSINSNTFANRPAAGQTGRLFVSTDTFEIYRDNGTTWDLIGGPGSSTITGTGTATQVAYFTSSQAIGSSANLFWDNTSGFLGVATATPSARIEAVKTDGVGIYSNFTTNAGSGSSTTALWAKNVTNSSGFAAVIEETTPNTTAGQYPLLIKHSLSSGTAGVGMGTGLHFQLPDDAGTFKTTQLTIETIDAAAATYATRYRFNVQSNGTGTPVAYINATGLGIFTATPSAALDIHSTGTMARLNSTSATGNSLLAFQRIGTGLWRIGDFYNGGANYFEIHNTVLNNNAVEIFAATNKSIFTALETYTTGLARGNYFDYNLSVSAGGSFSSPNAITALGASLDLTLAGSATIPSGARSGLDAYNSISFTGTGTLTHTQGTQIRAYSNLTAGWAFNGTATGTITHLAGLRALFPDNTGSAVSVTNNYGLLINDQTANTGTVTYTNRWGVYQEGASDLNYFAANTLIGTTVNSGEKLVVSGTSQFTNLVSITGGASITLGLRALQLPTGVESTINSGLSVRTGVAGESIVQFGNNLNTYYTGTVNAAKAGAMIRLDTRAVAPTPNASAYSVFQIQTRAAGTADPNYTVPVQIAAAPNGSFCIDTSGRGYFYNGMRVGASASAPSNALSVTGNADFTASVGIGTTSPASTLNVLSTKTTALITAADFLTLGATIDDNTAYDNIGVGGGIAFRAKRNVSGTQTVYGAIDAGKETALGDEFRGALRFYTNQNATGVPLERMRIDSVGTVGINTTGRPSGVGGGDNGKLWVKQTTSGNYGIATIASANDSFTYIAHNGTVATLGSSYGTTGSYTDLTFQTSDTIRARFTSGGNFLIGTTTDAGQKLQVNGVVATDGVKFPATQVPSADVNTLDDYEEGTFTPALGTGGDTTGFVYSTQVGEYTKIGNLVNVRITVVLTTLGGSAGNTFMYSLPFTNGQNVGIAGTLIIFNAAATLTNPVFIVSGSNNYGGFYKNNGANAITQADLTNTTEIYLNLNYRV